MSDWKTKEQATKIGEETLAKMKIGKGEWVLKVHQNLGWWCSIQWKFFNIGIYDFGHPIPRYSLLIGHDGCGIVGIGDYQVDSDDPNELIEKALPIAIDGLKHYTEVHDFLEKIKNEHDTSTNK